MDPDSRGGGFKSECISRTLHEVDKEVLEKEEECLVVLWDVGLSRGMGLWEDGKPEYPSS